MNLFLTQIIFHSIISAIFDDVSLENPEVAAKIPYPRMEAIMSRDGQKGLRERTRAGTVLLVPKKFAKK